MNVSQFELSSNKFACRGCTERYVGCHAECEKYKTAKAELDNRKKACREDLAKYDMALRFTLDDIYRKKKKARKKG